MNQVELLKAQISNLKQGEKQCSNDNKTQSDKISSNQTQLKVAELEYNLGQMQLELYDFRKKFKEINSFKEKHIDKIQDQEKIIEDMRPTIKANQGWLTK